MAEPSAKVKEVLKHYPLRVKLEGCAVTRRPMVPADGPALLDFARKLPQHDILFLRRDITKQEGIDKWVKDLEHGIMYSILAEDADGICGYSIIHLTDLEWSKHMADLRVSTAERSRGIGLGRLLTREAFNMAMALGIEKVMARMTPDQQGARALFQELGFQPEALLKDAMKDRAGNYHDLLVMAVNVQTFLAQRSAYGVGG